MGLTAGAPLNCPPRAAAFLLLLLLSGSGDGRRSGSGDGRRSRPAPTSFAPIGAAPAEEGAGGGAGAERRGGEGRGAGKKSPSAIPAEGKKLSSFFICFEECTFSEVIRIGLILCLTLFQWTTLIILHTIVDNEVRSLEVIAVNI